jgi:hypothetical protein
MKTDTDKLDSLVKTFSKHAKEARKARLSLVKDFQKNYPDEPIPNYLKEDFDLPDALSLICTEISNIKKWIEENEKPR